MQDDPAYLQHPKVVKAGRAAAALHLACVEYAKQNGTGGFVPFAALAGISADWARLVDRLVVAVKSPPSSGRGLLVPVDGGVRVHDFGGVPDPSDMVVIGPHEYVRQYRAYVSGVRAAVGRRGGVKSGATRRNKQPPAQLDLAPPVACRGGRGGSVSGSVSDVLVGADLTAEPALTRASDVPNGWKIDQSWVRILGVIPQGAGMAECMDLLRTLAGHTGKRLDVVADEALTALGAIMAERRKQYRSYKPYAMVDNWERVQRVMTGLDSTGDPQRGQLAVTQVDEAPADVQDGEVYERRR